MALELLKPWLSARLEEQGHATTIKHSKRLVEQRDPQALAALDAVMGAVPFILFNETAPAHPGVVSVNATVWDEPALGLSAAVVQALGVKPGQQVVVHVPIDRRAVEEARALTIDRTPRPPPSQVEGWLTKVERLDRPGALLMQAALYGEIDPVRDRISRMVLGRLDVD
jgi:hypothetical protein